MGPDALRTAGIGRLLEQLGFAVEDHGNLAVPAGSAADAPAPANAKFYDDIKAWIRALSERAFRSRDPARFRSSWAATTASRWAR